MLQMRGSLGLGEGHGHGCLAPPGRIQAARGRETVLTNSMHSEASVTNLSVKRLDYPAARERRTEFLSPVS